MNDSSSFDEDEEYHDEFSLRSPVKRKRSNEDTNENEGDIPRRCGLSACGNRATVGSSKNRKISILNKIENVFSKLVNLGENDVVGVIETVLDPPSQVSLSCVNKFFRNRFEIRIFKTNCTESERSKTNYKSWFLHSCVIHGHPRLLSWGATYGCCPYGSAIEKNEVFYRFYDHWKDLMALACKTEPPSFDVIRALFKCCPKRKSKMPDRAIAKVLLSDDSKFIEWTLEDCISKQRKESLSKSVRTCSISCENTKNFNFLRFTSQIRWSFPLDMTVFFQVVKKGNYDVLVWLLSDRSVKRKLKIVSCLSKDELARDTTKHDCIFSGDIKTIVLCFTMIRYLELIINARIDEEDEDESREKYQLLQNNPGTLCLQYGHVDVLNLASREGKWWLDPSVLGPFEKAREFLNGEKTNRGSIDEEEETADFIKKMLNFDDMFDYEDGTDFKRAYLAHCVSLSVQHGKFETVRWLFERNFEFGRPYDRRAPYPSRCDFILWDEIKYEIARQGELNFLKWMHGVRKFEPNDEMFLACACTSGNISLLDWAVEENIIYLPIVVDVERTQNRNAVYRLSEDWKGDYDSSDYYKYTLSKASCYDWIYPEAKNVSDVWKIDKNPYLSAAIYCKGDDVTLDVFKWLRAKGFPLNQPEKYFKTTSSMFYVFIGLVDREFGAFFGKLVREYKWESFLWLLNIGCTVRYEEFLVFKDYCTHSKLSKELYKLFPSEADDRKSAYCKKKIVKNDFLKMK